VEDQLGLGHIAVALRRSRLLDPVVALAEEGQGDEEEEGGEEGTPAGGDASAPREKSGSLVQWCPGSDG